MANETTSTTTSTSTSVAVPAQGQTEQTAPANENVQGVSASGTSVAAPATKEAAPAAESHHETTYNPKMPEPQIINGVKVYPTSYIPARAELHYPKKMLYEMQNWHIEASHVVIFFIVLFVLFLGPWKRPDQR